MLTKIELSLVKNTFVEDHDNSMSNKNSYMAADEDVRVAAVVVVSDQEAENSYMEQCDSVDDKVSNYQVILHLAVAVDDGDDVKVDDDHQ